MVTTQILAHIHDPLVMISRPKSYVDDSCKFMEREEQCKANRIKYTRYVNMQTWIFPWSSIFPKMLKLFAKIHLSKLNILLGKCIICYLVLFWNIWKTNTTTERKRKRTQIEKNNNANQQNERVFPPFLVEKVTLLFAESIDDSNCTQLFYFFFVGLSFYFFLALRRWHSERI